MLAALFFSARKSCGSMSAFSSVSVLTNVTDQRSSELGRRRIYCLALGDGALPDPARNSPLTATPTQASPHPLRPLDPASVPPLAGFASAFLLGAIGKTPRL